MELHRDVITESTSISTTSVAPHKTAVDATLSAERSVLTGSASSSTHNTLVTDKLSENSQVDLGQTSVGGVRRKQTATCDCATIAKSILRGPCWVCGE